MKKLNLAITGCLGRMGQQIIKTSNKDKEVKLVALTEDIPINKKIYSKTHISSFQNSSFL